MCWQIKAKGGGRAIFRMDQFVLCIIAKFLHAVLALYVNPKQQIQYKG